MSVLDEYEEGECIHYEDARSEITELEQQLKTCKRDYGFMFDLQNGYEQQLKTCQDSNAKLVKTLRGVADRLAGIGEDVDILRAIADKYEVKE